MAERIVFLPGAGGDGNFWAPVSSRLSGDAERVLVTWPGFADSPRDPSVSSLPDLVPSVERHLAGSATLVAQSMGGVVAVLTALANLDRVDRLVLVATSGGIDMTRFGARDWRPRHLSGRRSKLPTWFVDDRTDLTAYLSTLAQPTLLIFGDSDETAPVAAGEFLRETLPNAQLRVVAGGKHDMAVSRADEMARLIEEFLEA